MKFLFKLFACFLLSFSLIGNSYADELDSEQKELRHNIFRFLQEEGFVPELDSDGDIKFKREGTTLFISVSSTDSSPMYVTFSAYYSYGSTVSKNKLEKVVHEVNKYKGIKIYINSESYIVRAEMYLRESEAFCNVFNKLAKQITSASKEIRESCSEL